MTHPNMMTAWKDIACERGHTDHGTKRVFVGVGGPTPYADLPPIPERYTREFDMFVYSWQNYRDGAGYCPAHDAVSETIDLLGVWEPAETTLILAACTAADPSSGVFVDIGSQLGWFTLLAASCGLCTTAYEADPVNAETTVASMRLNGWAGRVEMNEDRIGPGTKPLTIGDDERVAVAKIDVEGAEPDAVRMLWPLIEAGRVDNLLIEMSPCFHDGYPRLAADLVGVGYRMHMLPAKANPPAIFERFPHDLGPDLGELPPDTLAKTVAAWTQENVWFTLPSAPW